MGERTPNFPTQPGDSDANEGFEKLPPDELVIQDIERVFGVIPDASETDFWRDFYEAIEKGYTNFYQVSDFYDLIPSGKEYMSRKSLVKFHINMGMDFVLADKWGSRGHYKPFRLPKNSPKITESVGSSAKIDPATKETLEIGKQFGLTSDYLGILRDFGVPVGADQYGQESKYSKAMWMGIDEFYLRDPYDNYHSDPIGPIVLKNKGIDRIRSVKKTHDGTIIISYNMKNIFGENIKIINLELSKTPYE